MSLNFMAGVLLPCRAFASGVIIWSDEIFSYHDALRPIKAGPITFFTLDFLSSPAEIFLDVSQGAPWKLQELSQPHETAFRSLKIRALSFIFVEPPERCNTFREVDTIRSVQCCSIFRRHSACAVLHAAGTSQL